VKSFIILKLIPSKLKGKLGLFVVKTEWIIMANFGNSGYYALLGIFFLFGLLLGIGAYITSWILRARGAKTDMKISPYECGEETSGPTYIQFNARYYVWALIFLIFDVETLFILPWALVYRTFQPMMLALTEMAVFLLILLVGLMYAWKKGVLRWN